MNALQSYSSDNESDNDYTIKKPIKTSDFGTNYDDVGMDISEDSSADESESHKNNLPKSQCTKDSERKEASKSFDPGKTSTGNDSRLSDKKEITDRRSVRSNSKERSKERENRNSKRERSKERSIREGHSSSGSSNRGSRDNKDNGSRRSSDYRHSGRDDRRGSGRKSRSRSRDRRKSRSRSRSRSHERRRRRSRSRSRDRRRPHEIRKEAQQKLAAFKASNPNYDHNELIKRGMEAQLAEVQKNTGLTLPSYYNPAVMNPLKIAEQERKKKLLWGNKAKVDETANDAHQLHQQQLLQQQQQQQHQQCLGGDAKQVGLWANTKFSNDSDGKMAEKFKRLMGLKAAGGSSGETEKIPESKGEPDVLERQETMFSTMEKQYEIARLTTHTHKGFGLGFSSQPYLPK